MGNYQTSPSVSFDTEQNFQNQPQFSHFSGETQESPESLNVQELFTSTAISGARVQPFNTYKKNPSKSPNFRAAQVPMSMSGTPSFNAFSFGIKMRGTITYAMSSGTIEPVSESSIENLVNNAYPEAEMDEILEEQRKVEIKNKALEKIKLEKELQEELEKQKEQKELEQAGYEDVDGFHLFKEQMDLPYQEYHPDHHIDIEDKVEAEI